MDAATVVVVMVKVCEVAPAGTVTLDGTVMDLVLELDSETTTPPAGAADVRVTVPVPVCPPTIVLGVAETLLSAGGVGLTVSAKVLLTPASEAVSVTAVEVVTLPPVTVNVVDVDPCGITTLAGTLAPAVGRLERKTVRPSRPAAAVEETVPVAVPPLTIVLGLTEKVLSTGGGFTVIPKVTLVPP